MLVGSSFTIIPTLGRSNAASQPDVSHYQTQSPPVTKDDLNIEVQPDLREWLQQVEDQASTVNVDSNFYSMDRQLSLTGREALQAYVSNAEFSFHVESTQLMGIDTYA